MKKFLLLAFALLFINGIYATTHIIQVTNFQFSPASVNASVGDTAPAAFLIKQTEMAAVEGINNAHFHTGALAAGTYILQCTMDGIKETRQIVVQ